VDRIFLVGLLQNGVVSTRRCFGLKFYSFSLFFVLAATASYAQNFYGEYYKDQRGGSRSYYAYITPDTLLFEVKDYGKHSTKARAFVFYPEDSLKQIDIDTTRYNLTTASRDTERFVVAINASNKRDSIRLYQISKYTTQGVGQWYDDVISTTKTTGQPERFRQFVMDTLADREWVLTATYYFYDERRRCLLRDGPEQLYFSQQEQQQIVDAYAERGKYLSYGLVVKERRWWKRDKLRKVKRSNLDDFFAPIH
jgi:hypothetical protein